MNSCLYECSVMHHRLLPKENQFHYRIFFFAFDLDEIDALAARLWSFSRNRWNLYTFRDQDHLSLVPGSIKVNVIAYLASQGLEFPVGGRILLVTLPRVLGYIFNPVSFYFCFNERQEPIAAIAEVGNTFREMKLYFLSQQDERGHFRLKTPKHFYVSPFSSLDLQFDFKLPVPGNQLDIHIDDWDGEKQVLLSAVSGKKTPLTNVNLAWMTLKYPLITLKVISLIHWHALLLWFKGVPWFAKTAGKEQQKNVLRPHAP